MIEDRKLAAALAKRKEERVKEKARGTVDIGIHEAASDVVHCIICGSITKRKDGLECYMCRKETGYSSFSKAALVTGRHLMNLESKYMLGYSAGQSSQEDEDDA